MAKLSVKVTPGASRDKIVGWHGDTLKVTVRAPPEAGKANAAVEALLAGVTGVPVRAVSVVSGHGQPWKTVEITGLTDEQLAGRLPSR